MNRSRQQEQAHLHATIHALRTDASRMRGWSFDDAVVEQAIELVDRLDLARFEQWAQERRKGPGGRPSSIPLRALLVAFLLGATHLKPYLATVWSDILFKHLSAKMRTQLGLPDPPEAHDLRGWHARYRAVLRRFHSLVDCMDPSPFPRNRRLAPAEFKAQMKDLSDDEIQERYDRLTWFINQLIELSLRRAPEAFRQRWAGSVGLDATNIIANTRGDQCAYKRKPNGDWVIDYIVRHSSESDAGRYRRGTDHRDLNEPGGRPGRAKKDWAAYEASIVIAGADSSDSEDHGAFPNLVVGMAPLHKPGADPGGNGVVALATLPERGHPVGLVACDRAYTQATPENFAYPARALGYDLVLDYRLDQLGAQGSYQGALLVEGTFYCPSMPQPLIDATADYRDDRIDELTYRKRIANRVAYAFRPNGGPNADGSIRALCPAAGAAPTLRCALKPASNDRKHAGKGRVSLNHMLKQDPPTCCRQKTITIPAAALDRYGQRHHYGTDDWYTSYSLLRNSIEGANGSLKDEAGPGVLMPSARRIRGLAPQSVLIALAIFALNIARIISFANKAVVGDDNVIRHLDKERARLRRAAAELEPPQPHLGDPPAEVA